eukprot:7500525-Heterocapsa_arctica.AAC.1
MEVVALHTELPPRSTCTASKTSTGEITRKELKGHCNNVHCLTCAGNSPRSGFNYKVFPYKEAPFWSSGRT